MTDVRKRKPKPEVTVTLNQWQRLREAIERDYSPRVSALRDERRKVVGYTERQVQVWVPNPSYEMMMRDWLRWKASAGGTMIQEPQHGWYETGFRLVFTGEQKFTLFCLKYAEILSQGK